MSPTLREYSTTLLVTATVTYLLTSLVRRFAIRVGAVPPARDRDVHAVPIPRMGGLAMYFGLAAGIFVARQMSPLQQVFAGTGLDRGLLLAGGLIVVVGMIDDRWGLPAIAKLAGQIAAGAILVASGAELNNFPIPNGGVFGLTPNESVVLTILVVVATINAVNFIDGLDGLAAGIVGIAAVSFYIYYYTLAKVGGLSAEGAPALAAVILAGACAGFLPHNFHPARIFMGDTGSMLLGLLLAYVPISAITQLDYMALPTTANRFPEILPLLIPAGVLVIPYTDLLRAVIRRTKAGMSPLSADSKHLHHQMLAVGHSHRSSVLILYAWALLFSGTVVALSIAKTPLLVLAALTAVAVMLLALLSIPKLRWWERKVLARRAAGDAGAVPASVPASGFLAAAGGSTWAGPPQTLEPVIESPVSPAVGFGLADEPLPVPEPEPVTIWQPAVPVAGAASPMGEAPRGSREQDEPRVPRFVPNRQPDPLGLDARPRFVPKATGSVSARPRFVPATEGEPAAASESAGTGSANGRPAVPPGADLDQHEERRIVRASGTILP